MRKEPPIFRCSEYVSSGGGVRRCFSITGMRLWILLVVDWQPNLKSSLEAKASPRIITASTWAFIIAWKTWCHLENEHHASQDVTGFLSLWGGFRAPWPKYLWLMRAEIKIGWFELEHIYSSKIKKFNKKNEQTISVFFTYLFSLLFHFFNLFLPEILQKTYLFIEITE